MGLKGKVFRLFPSQSLKTGPGKAREIKNFHEITLPTPSHCTTGLALPSSGQMGNDLINDKWGMISLMGNDLTNEEKILLLNSPKIKTIIVLKELKVFFQIVTAVSPYELLL